MIPVNVIISIWFKDIMFKHASFFINLNWENLL